MDEVSIQEFKAETVRMDRDDCVRPSDCVQIAGHESAMSTLRASTLPAVETVSLEDPGEERWFIHLDPQSGAVAACYGIVLS